MSGLLRWASGVLDSADGRAAQVLASPLRGAPPGSPREPSPRSPPPPQQQQQQQPPPPQTPAAGGNGNGISPRRPPDELAGIVSSVAQEPEQEEPAQRGQAVSLPPASSASGEAAMARLRSRVAELEEEKRALEEVWSQSRAQVERLKQALAQREEAHARRLAEVEAVHELQRKQTQEEHGREVFELKAAIDAMQSDFHKALQLRDAVVREQEASVLDRVERDRAVIEALQRELAEARAAEAAAVERRRDAEQKVAELMEAHGAELQRQREEFAARERELRSRLESLRSREDALESHREQSFDELAQSLRAINELKEQCNRLQLQTQWLEADKRSLAEQLAVMKMQRQQDQREAAEAVQRERAQTEATAKQLAAAQARLAESEAAVAALSSRLAQSEAQVASANESLSRARLLELEERVRLMADSIMQKQAALDAAGAERVTLRSQLASERQRVLSLEHRVEELRARLRQAAETGDVEEGPISGGSAVASVGPPDDADGAAAAAAAAAATALRSRGPGAPPRVRVSVGGAAPTVARAVGFLDWIGRAVGAGLRRSWAVRLGFAAYMLLLHVWVAFVLIHFFHHQDGGVVAIPTIRAAGAAGAGAAAGAVAAAGDRGLPGPH